MVKTSLMKVPQYRELVGMHIASLRHLAESNDAQNRLESIGLPWPTEIGAFAGNDPLVAWRSPTEKLLLSSQPEPLKLALTEFAPGKYDTLVATELSEALSVHEVSGPHIDEWMAHLVDALAIPTRSGTCTRARMADVAVFLIRLEPEKLWLLSDSTIETYIQNWLEFSFNGAFPNTPISK